MEDCLQILHVCTLCLTMLLAIVGNVIVLTVIAFSKKLHDITGVFVINLALGDLGIAIFVLPFSIDVRINAAWNYRNLWCQIVAFLSIVFYTISLSSLALVSVERLFAIKYPLQYSQKMKHSTVRWMIVTAWVYAVLRALCPFLNFGEYHFSLGKGTCAPNYSADIPYTMIVLVIGVIIPAFIICHSYIYIAREARIQAKRGELVCNDDHCMYVPNRSRENRAAKILAIITGIFFICWIPYTIANTWSSFAGRNLPYHADSVTQWLTLLNSAMNPWMHSLLNRTFRSCAVKLWHRAKTKCVFDSRVEPSANNITESVPVRMSVVSGKEKPDDLQLQCIEN
ncbi:histamine H2 receptor-like [Glandiceps talaboti]